MPTKKANKSRSTDKTEQILTVLQDLFILQGLKAGINVNGIRRTLKIKAKRVSNISMLIKSEKNRVKRKPRA